MRIKAESEVLIRVAETNVIEKAIHWADPQILEIFSFPLIVDSHKATKPRGHNLK